MYVSCRYCQTWASEGDDTRERQILSDICHRVKRIRLGRILNFIIAGGHPTKPAGPGRLSHAVQCELINESREGANERTGGRLRWLAGRPAPQPTTNHGTKRKICPGAAAPFESVISRGMQYTLGMYLLLPFLKH